MAKEGNDVIELLNMYKLVSVDNYCVDITYIKTPKTSSNI